MAENTLTENAIKEQIKNYAARLDTLKAEMAELKRQLEEKENIGKQIIGGLKVLEELTKAVQ